MNSNPTLRLLINIIPNGYECRYGMLSEEGPTIEAAIGALVRRYPSIFNVRSCAMNMQHDFTRRYVMERGLDLKVIEPVD